MKRILFILATMTIGMTASAKLTVTRQTCNYQQGLAVVEGKARIGWQMKSDVTNDRQTAYRVVVKENVTDKTVYDSKKVASDKSQLVEIPQLNCNNHGYYWQVMVWDADKKPSAWSGRQQMRIVSPGLFSGARWVGAITKRDAKLPDGRFSNASFKKEEFKRAWADVDTLSTKSIVMRKEFTTGRKTITDAVVYISGMGHYEMRINGGRIGESVFAPLWSEYDKTVYYNVYDVTDELKAGGNAVSVLLGNGFFNVQRLGRYSKLQIGFGAPQLIMRLEINYSDGTRQVIESDDTWKYDFSPITYNCLYGGESYDARLEQAAAMNAGFDDSKWHKAVIVEGPKGTLRPQTAPPVKIMEEYPVAYWKYIDKDSLAAASKATKRKVDASAFVADMGQNLAGFPQITVRGKRGQKITLLVSEKLTRQGACDQRQTGRQHYYEYTLKGDGNETWHPRFAYYGFRYIQVEGAVMNGEPNPDGLPVLEDLRSCFIYNSAEEVSSFGCSNPLFTQAHRLIERAERSNMQSVLTDCPHREKLGWLEQDHLNGPSLLYNYDMTTYVPKVIRDIVDTQKPDGMVPTTAPQYVSFGNLFDDSPEWGSTLIILPFMYYEQYGDSTLIIDNYEAMKRYADYLGSRAKNGIVSHGLGDWYDYQENGPAGFSKNTPIPLVATAHYIYDLQLMCKAAKMVGNVADYNRFGAELKKEIKAFHREFFNADSCYYGNNSQCSNALPIFLGIDSYAVDNDSDHKRILGNLLSDIKARGYRLTTGDVGNRYLIQALAMNGHNELVYKMFNHSDSPGYGCQLAHGMTTLSEQWDPRNGTSLNHFMMGQIDEWLFKSLGGIRQKPGTHGMRHLLIEPTLVGDLQHVEASTASLYGRIAVDCSRTKTTVEIPVGCDATVILPNGERHDVGSGTHTFRY